MGCQDGTGSVRLRSIFCQRGWFPGFPCAMPNKISASNSVRWEPDRIFAYHRWGSNPRPRAWEGSDPYSLLCLRVPLGSAAESKFLVHSYSGIPIANLVA